LTDFTPQIEVCRQLTLKSLNRKCPVGVDQNIIKLYNEKEAALKISLTTSNLLLLLLVYAFKLGEFLISKHINKWSMYFK
jgi:hypothetical protein